MRMATLKATKVLEALQKAKQVGRVEEAVTIAGCPLVLQNLSPDDYNAIHADTKALDEVEYLHAYQIGHVSRAIVEIGDQDLRDVEFIEDEVPTGAWGLAAHMPSKKLAEQITAEIKKVGGKASVIKPDGETRTIKLECHEWLHDLVAGWGRETVTVAWRKVMDVVAMGEEKAKEGVQFKVPDETSEERYRRLLGELKETEDDLPAELIQSTLAEMGYQPVSTPAELEAADQKLQELSKSQEQAPQAPPQAPQAPPAAPVAPTTPEPAPAPQAPPEAQQQAPTPPPVDPAELMRRRQQLNQQGAQVPTPQQSPTLDPASRPAPVPDQLRKAAEMNTVALQQQGGAPPLKGRAAEIAALEAQLDPSVLEPAAQQPGPRQPHAEEIPELSQRTEAIDGKALKASVDQPPLVGINPRFKPPPGMGPAGR
jgi:hypothetical protein